MYRDLIGIPYKPHGRDKTGYDCHGLAIEVLRRNGLKLLDTTECDIVKGVNLEPVENPVNLCIVDMKWGIQEHYAVCIGDGMIIHSIPMAGVIIEPLWRYKSRIKGYYKVTDICL